jgi:hypothetical protein
MHHSGMDMDHGHGDMDMGGQCNMNVRSSSSGDIYNLVH